MDDSFLKIRIYLYTRIVNYDDFLTFKTRVNLIVVKALEMDNIKIAYPGENLYMMR